MKRTAEKHPQKVQKDKNQQRIGAPVMNIANQLAKEHIVLQMNYRFIGAVGYRLIDKFEHQAGRKQHEYQHNGHPAKAPGQREPERALLNAARAEVQNQTVKKTSITLAANRWFPERAGENGIVNSLKQGKFAWRHILDPHCLCFWDFWLCRLSYFQYPNILFQSTDLVSAYLFEYVQCLIK